MSEKAAKSVDREELDFLRRVVEAVDDYLNAPFPAVREEALDWLREFMGDRPDDETQKGRQVRLDEHGSHEGDCQQTLKQAFAWKDRQRKVEPAPVFKIHRRDDKQH